MKCFLPDPVVMDYKCLVIDKQIDTTTAERIMKSAPVAVELPETDFTRVKNADTECYHIDKAFWDTLPAWEWMDIFKANGVVLPDVPKMKRLNKAARKENAGGQEQDASAGVAPWKY